MSETKERPPVSKNPEDYVEIDGLLVCKKCGGERELWACKCGKSGTKGFILEHIDERWAKNTRSANEAHMLVRPDPLTIADDKDGWLDIGSIEHKIFERARQEAGISGDLLSPYPDISEKVEEKPDAASKTEEPKAKPAPKARKKAGA